MSSGRQVIFSIRYKFLLVMSLMLTTCVCIFLVLAIQIFKKDKNELVYDLNRSQVSNLASELGTEIEGISDKFKIFAMLSTNGQKSWLSDLFSKDSEVIYVSLFKNGGKEISKKFENKSFRETYGLPAHYFEKQGRTIPFSKIFKNGETIWNASIGNGPPLIGFGRSIVVEDERGVVIDQMAVVGYLKSDRILEAIKRVKLSEITVANSDGEILAHTDPQVLREKSQLNSSPLFQAALESKTKTNVLKFRNKEVMVLGAFSKSRQGKIVVLAQASEEAAFVAVSELVERSLIFSLIVMTGALLVSILLSRSLTSPLAKLVERMNLVSQGDLTTQVVISTRDETAVLAQSFNQMIEDLRRSRDQLEEVNRDLDQKVKDRTTELENQNRKVKEAQEALLRTTRLASVGEIAGRAAHEVLNPLTSLLTRVGLMERKIKTELTPQLQMLEQIHGAWEKDFNDGGFEKLVGMWAEPSQIKPQENMWQEDLNNLKGVALGCSERLLALYQDTQFLLGQGARINKIINGMRKLSISRSDKRVHPVHEILKDCCDIMADLFSQRGFQVSREFHAEKDAVSLDRDELVQAVTNMMRNSLQAMHEIAQIKQHHFQGILSLVTEQVGDQVHIFIKDNGAGISIENQAKLFDGQFTTKSSDEGTGLGLGISRRFVRGQGGDIEFVSSEPGKMTVFMIKLPLAIAENKGVAA